jgi:hypothetical protein
MHATIGDVIWDISGSVVVHAEFVTEPEGVWDALENVGFNVTTRADFTSESVHSHAG